MGTPAFSPELVTAAAAPARAERGTGSPISGAAGATSALLPPYATGAGGGEGLPPTSTIKVKLVLFDKTHSDGLATMH